MLVEGRKEKHLCGQKSKENLNNFSAAFGQASETLNEV